MISVGSEVQILPGPPLASGAALRGWRGDWGLSSAGRAPALQAGGHRFDPDSLHQDCLVAVCVLPMVASVMLAALGVRPAWRGGLVWHRVTTAKFRFGALIARQSAGCSVLLFGASGLGARPGRLCCVHLQCESGSGASLGAPRSAKSDRMCRRSDTFASETAALCVQRRCENAELN